MTVDRRRIRELQDRAVELADRIERTRASLSAPRARLRRMQPIQRTPQVKDIVRYCDVTGEWRPAIVTQVHSDECVNVQYINVGGTATWATSVSRGGDSERWDFVAYE